MVGRKFTFSTRKMQQLDDTNEFLEAFRDSSPAQVLGHPAIDQPASQQPPAPITVSAEGGLPDLVRASELPPKAEIKLPPSIIEGVLHAGHKMVIGGGSKSYKSWSLIDLAASVARGDEWWGWQTVKSNVIYLNLEIQSEFFHHRLWDVTSAKSHTDLPDNLYMWHLRGHYYDIDALEANLSLIIEKMNVDVGLLVIDPIYKAFLGDENSAGDVKQFLATVEHFSAKTGAAICYGAHFSKGNQADKEAMDRIAGSGVHARDPDAVLVMTKHDVDDCFSVNTTIRNNPPVDDFVVEWSFPLMRSRGDLDPSDLKRIGKVAGRPAVDKYQILDKLGSGGINSGKWQYLCPCGETTFRKLRDELVRTGLVRMQGGLYYKTMED